MVRRWATTFDLGPASVSTKILTQHAGMYRIKDLTFTSFEEGAMSFMGKSIIT